VLFDMKKDMSDLKKLVHELMIRQDEDLPVTDEQTHLVQKLFEEADTVVERTIPKSPSINVNRMEDSSIEDTEEIIEESLSLEEKEIELIQKALKRHNGKRKLAAQDLGISERTLYRKIKEYNIDE